MTWRGTDVTVVVPTYNRADLIGKSIASIQAQSAPVAAIVIVDDGSTDNTHELVAQLAAIDPRIMLVKQANAGANVARNNGIGHAATALVAFLDSDDRWEPDKIDRQLVAWALRPDAVASFTGILAVDGDRPLYHYDIPVDPTLDDLRRHNALGTTSAAMVRTDVLRSVGGFDPTLPSCQDWDLWLRLRRAGPFAVVTDSLVLYEDGPHERITGNPLKAIAGHRAVFVKALADVTGWRARARICASHAEVMSRLYRRAGRRGAASAQAARALMLDPGTVYARKLLRTLFR